MAVILTCCLLLLFLDSSQSYNQLVIPGKTQATSSSVYCCSYIANNTVDGDFRQDIAYCLHTSDSAQNAWLRVDLGKIYSIKYVKFWYRNDRGTLSTARLSGYSIRVSNDSTVPPSEICYTDPAKVTLPTVIDNDCQRTSQYVWFYQTRALSYDTSPMLEICEVRVFGCDTGRFGVDCSNTCDHCKNKARCGIERGECDNLGCAKTGERPPLCGACPVGYYGEDCGYKCSGHCLHNVPCNKVDGTCTACMPGWQNSLCSEPCSEGSNEVNCMGRCSGHCLNGARCTKVDRTCTACMPEWQNWFCTNYPNIDYHLDISCLDGTYGTKCTSRCSGHCLHNDPCNKVDGTCTACMPGWQNRLCSEPCQDGTYGGGCTNTCSEHCQDFPCNKTDGTCRECEPGWHTKVCNELCLDGTYGTKCTSRCSGHCLHNDPCNKVDGTCTACMPGWKNSLCTEPCQDGTYGKGCTNTCSEHCQDFPCNKTDGTCTECKPGWHTKVCNEPCTEGRYGPGCKNQCGHCFGSDACFHNNGSCPGNCGDGYTGEKCTGECERGRYGPACQKKCGHCLGSDVCFHVDGSCPGNCSDGFIGDTCFDTCKFGWYGPGCNESCGHCAGSDVCMHTNGSCPGNCSDGYIGEKCSETCRDGWYGPGCEYQCGFCNASDVCLKTNGSCPGICSQGYTGHKCKVQIEPLYSPEGIPVKTIIVPLLAVLFSFVIVFGIFIFFRRRGVVCRRKQIEQFSLRNILLHAEEHNDTDPDFKEDHVYYNNFQIETKKIRILDLMTTIQTLDTNDNKEFEKEYKSIPYGERPDVSCTVGKTSENTPKNRFKEIYPYDHSRVVLKATQNRDYINASFIKNAYGQTAYIATQAPKHSTVLDFWQMVWQENIGVIAMVTDLTEGDSIKCVMYWPESPSKKLVKGKFIVRLVNEKIYANFAVRRLKIDNKETKTSRHVTQLQFTAWPDHGTPLPVDLLVFYLYVSREMEKCPESKLVVHCSAGVGRTGTFIALDALYRQGQKEGKINIVEYVNTMREDRMNMIQNFNQYKFLYKILYESFRSGCHIVNKCDFVSRTQSEMSPEKAANFSYFRKEFKELETVKPVFTENDLKVGKQNLDLNMTKTVLPSDRMRLILCSHVPGRGTYYNAVPLNSFKRKDCIVAAQYPVPGAAVDLIRLMVDHTCGTLVSTMPLTDIPSTNEWYNLATKRVTLLNYQVDVDERETISDHVTRSSVRMKPKQKKDWHTVDIYEIKPWDIKEDTSGSVEAVLDVVNIVQQNENVDPENKLLILSRDGATGCDVFCAVYNAIQQLEQDEEVDMYTIVRQLQSRRPEMISDINEYMFCCQAVARFIGPEPENIYMNSDEKEETEVDPANTEENLYANM